MPLTNFFGTSSVSKNFSNDLIVSVALLEVTGYACRNCEKESTINKQGLFRFDGGLIGPLCQ